MMRLARRASLLVAFSLLTSAVTASAECAWVCEARLHRINGLVPYLQVRSPSLARTSRGIAANRHLRSSRDPCGCR